MSTQPSAREFPGPNNKSKKNTAIEVVILMSANTSGSLEPQDLVEQVLYIQTSGMAWFVQSSPDELGGYGSIAGEIRVPIVLLAG